MTLLVTSAASANGAGYGKILAFADDGEPIGVFGSDPCIVDPRGLRIDGVDGLLLVNSGSDRILALDRSGFVVHASRSIVGLNPGGGNFGPDGRYYVGFRSERTIMAFARVSPYLLGRHNALAGRGMYLSVVDRRRFRDEAQSVYESILPDPATRLLTWTWPR